MSAFIAEPVSGTSLPGSMPPREYFQEVRRICDKYDVLFIADEVIMGTCVPAATASSETRRRNALAQIYQDIPQTAFTRHHLVLWAVGMAGLGRTGANFAIQHSGIEPDLITTAKGLCAVRIHYTYLHTCGLFSNEILLKKTKQDRLMSGQR